MRFIGGRILLFLICTATLQAQAFELFGDRNKVILPFEMRGNLMIISCQMEGLPMNFIFDTGAENVVLFERWYTDLLGVSYDMRIPVIGSNLHSPRFALVARDLQFSFSNYKPIAMDILVLEEYEGVLEQTLGKEIHGLLGSSFFQHYIVEFNYRHRKIILHKANKFEFRQIKKYKALPIHVHKGKPLLPVTICQSPEKSDPNRYLFLMDTGADVHCIVHANTDSSLYIPEDHLLAHVGSGISGPLFGYLGRISLLSLGPYTFRDMIVHFQQIDSVHPELGNIYRNGILGNQLWKRFHIILDMHQEMVYLKPYGTVNEEFAFDRSGMSVIVTGPSLKQYRVQSIVPNSPAHEAGLQQGDQILRLQCLPMFFHSLHSIHRLFRKSEGKLIRMKIKRGEERQKIKFRLRELL